ACHSPEPGLDGAQVLTTITRAAEPFIDTALIADCRHINAVGAILPGKAEIAQDVMRKADFIAGDDKENAVRGSQELRDLLGTELCTWTGVKSLSELLVAGESRPANAQLTLCKGRGMGMSDLPVARRRQAAAARLG